MDSSVAAYRGMTASKIRGEIGLLLLLEVDLVACLARRWIDATLRKG